MKQRSYVPTIQEDLRQPLALSRLRRVLSRLLLRQARSPPPRAPRHSRRSQGQVYLTLFRRSLAHLVSARQRLRSGYGLHD